MKQFKDVFFYYLQIDRQIDRQIERQTDRHYN